MQIDWPESLEDFLQSAAEAKVAKRGAKAAKKAMDGTQAAIDVMKLGQGYWQRLLTWPQARKSITPKELAIVSLAAQGRALSDKQGVSAMEARDKAIDDGFE